MGDTEGKKIAVYIERAISSCFEMVSELTYMRTMLMTGEDRYSLRDRLDYIVDIDKSIGHELGKLNDLV